MHAIQDQGFRYCTPIQAEVLGSALEGRDAIGKAQTGTGKTAAFLITGLVGGFSLGLSPRMLERTELLD
jgi:superfamily II DNA/RNA helicase